jgi:four helix bundle protein
MHDFRKLLIWKRSMDMAERTYRLTAMFPAYEKFGIVSQLRRCSVSIPSNISEGAGRNTNRQFRQFLEISMGSCNELQTQLELACRFGYIDDATRVTIIVEACQIYSMIYTFYRSLKID